MVPVFYTIADGFVGSRPVRWLGRKVSAGEVIPLDAHGHPVAPARAARSRLEQEI